MSSDLNRILAKRPIIFDGAMGTMLAAKGIKTSCNEELCLTNQEVVASIHREYLNAGADVIITNTFGASKISLADHGLAHKVREINLAAAEIALKEKAKIKDRPCLVAGELGPTSKLPTLGHITFDELFSAYSEQTSALLDGNVDMLIINTCQDPLQAKAAAAAVRSVLAKKNKNLPLIISVTIERVGTMLLGTEITAALAALAPYKPFAFGINCATGPDAMEEHLAELAKVSPFAISCRPNAGMPEIVNGKSHYPLLPDDFARILADYVKRFGIAIVGGCCGTTPEHIAALAKNKLLPFVRGGLRWGRSTSPRPSLQRRGMVSSLYTAAALDQEPRPFIIAEQTNVNGSKKFRELLLKNDFDAMAEIGRNASTSSHALDVCMAYVGRDESKDFLEITRRLVLKSEAALMIDSTNPSAIEAALSCTPGRSIINSINLEDGGKNARTILELARRFGAAVVALTIDEDGMAREANKKLSIAKRLVALANEYEIGVGDLLIDPLTFTLASGETSLKDAAKETLSAISKIKKEIPGTRTILGVSNISFGLPLHGRAILTSAFLHRAVEHGLDAAIINPLKIMPLDRIPKDALEICTRLIDNNSKHGDPLAMLLDHLSKEKGEEDVTRWIEPDTPAEAVRMRVIEGSRKKLPELIEALIKEISPQDAINKVLLPAMQEVGKRFSAGRMPLPFVLESAEVMRAAIDLISPHMKAGENKPRATIVLATVRGDVHDIGKNLVDAIISNNNFHVINLGIRQPASAIIEAVKAQNADAIGLSGLLVSSTEIMREDLELFRAAGIKIPVLCGGAALTKKFVEDILAKAYNGDVRYCQDAFAGLNEMEKIAKNSA